ncbi:MAG TPA: dihydropyrimidinase [Thermoflexales bacterium]|nr:dihydropyrimidinase [Thermoflexales bacterium]
MATTLIKNGRIVTASDEYTGDILIDDEKIALIGDGLMEKGADTVIDAKGRYILPGGIDVHTHLDMPFGGTVSSDDFFTGHKAALFGGTTAHVDFCIQPKGKSLRESLDLWHAKAKGKAAMDYGFHVAVTDLNDAVMAEIAQLPKMGVTSIKLFMAYKGVLQVDDTTLFRCLRAAKASGVLTMVHAENGDAIDVLVKDALAAGNLAPIWHALTRPAELEAEATNRAIELARVAGDAPLFVVHLTNAMALHAIANARKRGQHAYAETCVQYFHFTKDNLNATAEDAFNGAKWVCSPPFREASDQAALMRGIRTGDLVSVSTDHCPFNYKTQKTLGAKSFAAIPNGVPGIEDRMYMLWDAAVRTGQISPSRFVELTATNPAKLFGLYPRKGAIIAGADADLVIWDPKAKHTVSAKTHHMRVDYNLYEGREVTGKPVKVFLRGKLVVDGKRWLGAAGAGRFLERRPAILL